MLALDQAEMPTRPVTVVLVRTVNRGDVAEIARRILDQVAVPGGLDPPVVGGTSALPIHQHKILLILLDAVAARGDRKIFAQRREIEMAATGVEVTLRRR